MRRLIHIAALTLIMLAGSCGREWDLDSAFSLAIDSPELPAASVVEFFTNAVQQLGGRVLANSSQIVHIDYQDVAACYGCTPITTEHVDYHGDTIHVYGRYKLAPSDALEVLIKHGLVHVLGYEQHLAASTGAMMAPRYCDIRDHHQYTPLDVQAVCSMGRVRGGVCK